MHRERDHLMQLTPLVCQFLEALDLIVKVTTDSNSRNGVSEVSSQLRFSTLGLSIRETEENPTGCQLPLKETYGVSQG